MEFKKFIVIFGHYGSGKTNFSLNLAKHLSVNNKKVTVVDLDVVNPYFCTTEFKDILSKINVKLISPNFAGSTLDVPSLSAEINSVFSSDADHIIFDVGGDDAGAFAIGRYSAMIKNEDYEAIYVINKYREIISTPDSALEILREIEKASRINATSVVNNSHLCDFTSEDDILNSLSYADDICKFTNLPLKATAVIDGLDNINVKNKFLIEKIVKTPWG